MPITSAFRQYKKRLVADRIRAIQEQETSKAQAKAEVLKAKYAELGANREVYLAELNREVANSLYSNLQNFQVQMPQNYIGGNQETGLKTNLDVITGFGALGLMEQTKKIAQQ